MANDDGRKRSDADHVQADGEQALEAAIYHLRRLYAEWVKERRHGKLSLDLTMREGWLAQVDVLPKQVIKIK